MADETYEGWSNRETWAFSLWINNDKPTYDIVQSWVEKSRLYKSPTSYLADKLEGLADEVIEEVFYEVSPSKAYREMARNVGSFWRVNFLEIAKNELD